MSLDYYYIEKKKRLNFVRVIHKNNCELLPTENGRIPLGFFESTIKAKTSATNKFGKLKFCKVCCKDK